MAGSISLCILTTTISNIITSTYIILYAIVFEKRAPTRPGSMKVYFGMREESRGSRFHLQQHELPKGNPTQTNRLRVSFKPTTRLNPLVTRTNPQKSQTCIVTLQVGSSGIW